MPTNEEQYRKAHKKLDKMIREHMSMELEHNLKHARPFDLSEETEEEKLSSEKLEQSQLRLDCQHKNVEIIEYKLKNKKNEIRIKALEESLSLTQDVLTKFMDTMLQRHKDINQSLKTTTDAVLKLIKEND